MADDHSLNHDDCQPDDAGNRGSVKFEVTGLEMLGKQVKQSGNSGRIYLPPDWVGRRVKIIRLD